MTSPVYRSRGRWRSIGGMLVTAALDVLEANGFDAPDAAYLSERGLVRWGCGQLVVTPAVQPTRLPFIGSRVGLLPQTQEPAPWHIGYRLELGIEVCDWPPGAACPIPLGDWEDPQPGTLAGETVRTVDAFEALIHVTPHLWKAALAASGEHCHQIDLRSTVRTTEGSCTYLDITWEVHLP